MTLDEAIKHCKDVARDNRAKAEEEWRAFSIYPFGNIEESATFVDRCNECAEQHEQLAQWLEELKEYIESGEYKYSSPNIGQEEVELCIAVLEKEIDGCWISVDDILPENAERYKGRKVIDVLVTTEKGLVTKVQRQCYRGSWSWGRIFSRVVAWMPLPKAYKIEK
jgi:hypothetical protein